MLCLDEVTIGCPYCGEPVSLLLDCSHEYQTYIEDCEVCCRPISIYVDTDELGMGRLSVYTENQVPVCSGVG